MSRGGGHNKQRQTFAIDKSSRRYGWRVCAAYKGKKVKEALFA